MTNTFPIALVIPVSSGLIDGELGCVQDITNAELVNRMSDDVLADILIRVADDQAIFTIEYAAIREAAARLICTSSDKADGLPVYIPLLWLMLGISAGMVLTVIVSYFSNTTSISIR